MLLSQYRACRRKCRNLSNPQDKDLLASFTSTVRRKCLLQAYMSSVVEAMFPTSPPHPHPFLFLFVPKPLAKVMEKLCFYRINKIPRLNLNNFPFVWPHLVLFTSPTRFIIQSLVNISSLSIDHAWYQFTPFVDLQQVGMIRRQSILFGKLHTQTLFFQPDVKLFAGMIIREKCSGWHLTGRHV